MSMVLLLNIDVESAREMAFKHEAKRVCVLPSQDLSILELMQNHVVGVDNIHEL